MHLGCTGDELYEELRDYKKIVDTQWAEYESSDPLDIGMSLWSAHPILGCQEEDWAGGLCDRMLHSLGMLYYATAVMADGTNIDYIVLRLW